MNEEELKRISDALESSGLEVKDPITFTREIDNENLSGVVTRLVALKQSSNVEVDVTTFTEDIMSKLDHMEKRVKEVQGLNSDRFMAALEGMHQKFGAVTDAEKNYKAAQRASELELINIDEDYRKVVKDIYDLKNDAGNKNITFETISLNARKGKLIEAKKEIQRNWEEQKSIYEQAMKSLDVLVLQKDLSSAVGVLESEYRNLNLDDSIKDELDKVLNDIREKIVFFAYEIRRDRAELEKMCEKYGIGEKTREEEVELTVDAPEIEPEVPVQEPEVVEEPEQIEISEIPQDESLNPLDNLDLAVEEPKVINNLADLYQALKDKGLEFTTGIDELGRESIEIAADVNIEDYIPEGFHYDQVLGINNKVSDTEPCIALNVKVKERDLFDEFSELFPNEEEPVITSEVELVSALRDKGIAIKQEEGFFKNSKYVVDDATNLEASLPEGFVYDKESGIITNSKVEKENPVIIKVSVKERNNTVDYAPNVPSGRTKVKRTAKAKMVTAAENVVSIAALAAIAAAATPLTIVPTVAVVTGIVAVGQALYNKRRHDGKSFIPEIDDRKDYVDRDPAFLIAAMYKVSDWLKEEYENIREGFNKKNGEPEMTEPDVPVQEPEIPVEEPEIVEQPEISETLPEIMNEDLLPDFEQMTEEEYKAQLRAQLEGEQLTGGGR